MFRVERHKWWTADRSRLVDSGDPGAAFLAYPAGSEVPDDEARRVGLLLVPPGGPKSRAKPPDKAAPRPPDKGGLIINRSTDRSATSSAKEAGHA
jgi:hypothetical protein